MDRGHKEPWTGGPSFPAPRLYTVVSTTRILRRPAVDQLETYARAAASLTGLPIDEAWWPGVVRHLGVLCDRAALVAAVDMAAPRVVSGFGPGSASAAGGEGS
jgi:hypothetical protein